MKGWHFIKQDLTGFWLGDLVALLEELLAAHAAFNTWLAEQDRL